MAFPVVASTNVTSGTSSASPGVTINMPSGITAGDLLIAFCAGDSSVTYTASGWTSITDAANGTASQLTVFAKIAAGSDTMTLVGENNDYAVIVARITGHNVVTLGTDILKGTAATGADAAPNPPSVTISSTKDWLFLACFGADDDDIADPDTGYTGWPASYSAGVARRSATGTTSCCVAFAQRQLNTGTSQDPGTFTMTAAEEWIAQTFAIPNNPAVTLQVDAGSYAVTGGEPTITRHYRLQVDAGSYALTGFDAKIYTRTTVVQETVYVDGHIALQDNDSVWVNDANAVDGSTSTYATTTVAGTTTTNELYATGYNATLTALYTNTANVRARPYITTPTGQMNVIYQNQSRSNVSGTSGFTTEGWQGYSVVREILISGWDATSFNSLGFLVYGSGATVDVGLAKVEFQFDYLPERTLAIYNFDESDFVDAQSVWSSETNVNNSYTAFASLASNTTGGSSTNNALVFFGTAAPASGGEITDVYLRAGMNTTGSPQYIGNAEVWTAGKTTQLLKYTVPENTAAYIGGPWTFVPPPDGGWTWNILQNLELYVYGTNDDVTSNNLGLYSAQIKVFTKAVNAYTLQVDAGSYTVTGSAATFKRSLILPVDAGSYSVTGSDATLQKTFLLSVDAGSYTLTGGNPVIYKWKTTAVETAYVDAHVLLTDNDAKWTNDANAFDGSTGTSASCTTAGSGSTNELTGLGHTSTIPHTQLLTTRVRHYGTTPAGTLVVYWKTSAGGVQHVQTAQSGDGWTNFDELPDQPITGWSESEWDNLGITAYGMSTPNVTLARAEIEVTYIPNSWSFVYGVIETGFSDTQSVWTLETDINNAYAQSTWAQLAAGTTGGSSSNNALVYYGTNAVSSGLEIFDVYARIAMSSYSAGYDMHCEVWTSGKGTLLYELTVPEGSLSYVDGPWILIPRPVSGWTWGMLQGLEFYFWGTNNDAVNVGQVYLAQIKVFTQIPNAYTLQVDAGSYTVSGQPATLEHVQQFTLQVDAGSYAVSGQPATLTRNYKLSADAGSYAVSGSNPNVIASRYVSVNAGAYAVTGGDPTLARTRLLSVDAGSYALTGSSATLKASYRLPADAGSYAVAGQPATFQRGRNLSVDAGAYAVSGSDITFKMAYRLSVDAGDYALTGSNASLQASGAFSVEPGAYNVTGSEVQFIRGIVMQVDAGSYALTGANPALQVDRQLLVDAGSYVLTGSPVNLGYSGLRTRRVMVVG